MTRKAYYQDLGGCLETNEIDIAQAQNGLNLELIAAISLTIRNAEQLKPKS